MPSRISRQIILALFWFLSVYLAVGALLPWEWAWRCAWFNMIIGLLGLLLITRTEEGDKIFYKGPQGDEPGWWIIGFLWALPVSWLAAAAIWWFLRLLGIFDW